MHKFLVIQTAFIGDVVLATALLEKLHSFYPEAKLDILVRNGNEALFTNHPYINQVLIWHKKEKKYQYLLQLLQQIRLKNYDVVINVQRFAATGFLTAFSSAKLTIGFNKNPFSFLFTKKIKHHFGNAIHEVQRNHLLIASLTDDVVCNPKLYPSKADYASVAAYKQQPYIVIAPTSVWFTKQFPANKWVDFINQLPLSYPIYLIGAPTDAQACNAIVEATTRTNITNLAGQLSFLQSAALQQDAVMNYVNDSAPMHFASAVNAPTTAIYCSTLPSFGYGPLSDNAFIVEVQEKLPCRPCGIHGKKACPLGHFNCANMITNEQLLGRLE
ncbi:MAG: glycosyltransferase family 9 protein [Deinococcales bacterium]|nr:glycosyltransferase family 9 protein [Chitinophagaceae bacterium]